jgi:hypothetical protein
MAFIDLGVNDSGGQRLINLNSTAIDGLDVSSTSQANINSSGEPVVGGIDGANLQGATALGALGSESIFNPFTVFRYSEFGVGTNGNNQGSYDIGKHKNTYVSGGLIDLSAARLSQQVKAIIQNPSAVNIVDWTNNQALKGSEHKGPLYPYPYQLNDFLWCKWYGKIPNNRLITLRRYPIPVEDNLAIDNSKLPLVPIAQAVTWWGGSTGNKISEILGMTYGFVWKEETAKVDDVQGNEITVEQLLDTAGITNETARQALITAFRSNSETNPFAMSGYDATLQQFTKDSWERGAYWNRVLGPVNVIDTTKRRDRGYTFSQKISIDFEYKLRSYGNINPKVAMLDLISNFMSLTYNRASFWGGGYRYFQQTGALLPAFNTDAMEKGDYIGAAQEVASLVGNELLAKGDALKQFVDQLGPKLEGKTVTEMASLLTSELSDSSIAKDLVASRMGKMHQKPLLFRALLDGRAVGEWHLMIGNPMDPLAVMGNLCLTSTSISFSDELGADDFPTSVKFTVALESGRPRAKQDIESIFNHGGGDLGFTALQPPSSTMDSNGEYNSIRIAKAYGTENLSSATQQLNSSLQESAAAVKDRGLSVENSDGTINSQAAEYAAGYFKVNVAKRYGIGFGNSPILIDYFTKLKTKD